jgi:thiol:disulfide interchange protein DsbD
MFNVYHLQIPLYWQSKLSHFSTRQRSGKIVGVFVMGAISALIVGPCVAAPLASVLVYIGQSRDVVIGGAALFSMAVGMSIPLILIGVSAGALLPRAGPWMESVKQFFGVLMLGLAWWLVSPVLPMWLTMLGWAVLALGYGVFLMCKRGLVIKVLALLLCTIGVMEFIGGVTGSRDVLAPLAHLSTTNPLHTTEFKRIQSTAQLDQALAQAKEQNKPVMLDFYADWCVSCKEMEKFTFSDERVRAVFAGMILLQTDVTANNADDRALLKRFNLYGPPAIIFFDVKENEMTETGRVIGFETADRFLKSLDSFGQQKTRVNP